MQVSGGNSGVSSNRLWQISLIAAAGWVPTEVDTDVTITYAIDHTQEKK